MLTDIDTNKYEIARQWRDLIHYWRQNPVDYCKDILGLTLWSKQREIIESVRDNPRTTVRSASAVGKTLTAGCAVLWFMTCFRPSTVLTTGKSFRQVKEQLWREIRTKHSQSKIPIGGEITQTSLTLADDWFAFGFSTDEPDRITGFHNKHILVIVDEASGIPDEVYGAIENPLAAGFTRLLLLGNPTQGVGKFRDSFASPSYKSFHISAFDTPNITGEGNGAFSFLVNKEYIEERKLEWGEDSPLYEVYVLGEFPSGETDRLVPFGLAELAINKEIKVDEDAPVAIGVDTARMGDDENVLYVRHGGKVTKFITWRKALTEHSVEKISRMVKETTEFYNHPPVVNIDEGYNPGIVDGLKRLGLKVNGISFQGKPSDEKIFANIRAEMFWGLAKHFQDGDIQIPGDKILLKQLTDIKKKPLNRLDQIIIESKEEMKQRGLKSPDRADALALAFYEPKSKIMSVRWI